MQLFKSSSIISSGVLASRFLGFIRDIVLANLLGTGLVAEAFFVAQRIPNLFRDLVGEGAANAAIVPVLSEYQKTKTSKQWHQLVNVLLAWGTIILSAMTIVGMLLSPWIVKLMAPGFLADVKQYELAVDLTRMMFPYLILVALTALQMGILYTLHSFKAPAFSSCLWNMAVILSAWVASYFSWAAAYILAIGVIIGGVFQLFLQGRALSRLGLRWQWPVSLKHEGITKIGKLLLPRLWGSAVYQINIFVDTLCASLAFLVGSGGIAALYFANRLVQFPLGVFAYALSSAALPSLSASAAQGRQEEFKETLFFSLKNLLFVLLPCSVFLCVLSPVLVQVIFERGAFDQYSSRITAASLSFLSLGLPFFGATRILISGFYALQDTRSPVRIATVCLLINIILNVLLMFPLKIGGIALASSLSGLANFSLLFLALRDRLQGTRGVLKKFFRRMAPCLLAMGAVMYMFLKFLPGPAIVRLCVDGLIGIMMFLMCCYLMKVAEFKYLWISLKKKLKKSP